MAKYKVLREFRDIHTKVLYKKGQVIEMTDKRGKEAIKNLSDKFLEKIDRKEESTESKEVKG